MPYNESYPQGTAGSPSGFAAPAQPVWSQHQPAYAQPQPAYAQPQSGYASAGPAPSTPQPFPAGGVDSAPRKKSHGWIVALVIVLCLFLLGAFSIASCSSALSSIASSSSTGATFGTTGDTVAVITIDGTIQYDGTESSPEGLKNLLDQAEEDSNIKAVVLRVDSGGGTATAGEEMAQYVRDFSKPIVVSSASINASAAYELSSQADYIFVAKTTEIGAIGTVMQVTDLSELLNNLGVKMENIASADSKDSSYGTRPLTDEERAYYQALVDEINEAFVENVAQGRNLSMDQARELATGLPFAGTTAVHNGVADEIGTREDAMDKAAALAGVSEYDTIELFVDRHEFSLLPYLLSSKDKLTVNDLALLIKEQGTHDLLAR